MHGFYEVFDTMLARRADPNIINTDGNSCLTTTAWRGRARIIRSLLEVPELNLEGAELRIEEAKADGHAAGSPPYRSSQKVAAEKSHIN